MKELNICIDIDGTITEPYYWVEYANMYFKLNIKEEDVTKYEICDVLGISKKELNEFYKVYGKEMLFNAQMRSNARSVLWELYNKHNIYYVTARENNLRELTEKWFKYNDLPKGELYMLGSHYKVDKAKELNCHIFLEDRYENAVELSWAGCTVYLLDCFYNRNKLLKGIKRVGDWDEINRMIKLEEKSVKIA